MCSSVPAFKNKTKQQQKNSDLSPIFGQTFSESRCRKYCLRPPHKHLVEFAFLRTVASANYPSVAHHASLQTLYNPI